MDYICIYMQESPLSLHAPTMKNSTLNSTTSIFLTLHLLAGKSNPATSTASSIVSTLFQAVHPTTVLLFLLFIFFLFLRIHSESPGKPKQPHRCLPPGPKPWPLVGNLPELFHNKPAFRWILNLMKHMNTDIACIKLGKIHVIPVSCPEIAREFLKKQDALFASRPITMGTEYSSRGYLSTALVPWGDQWKKMRRVVASEVISPARIRWLQCKRVDEADNLVRYLYNQCSETETVDVRLAVRQYSGNVIRNMIFGRRYFGEGRSDGGPGVEEEEHVDALFTVLSLLYAFCVSDYMPCLRWLDLDGHEKVIKKALKIVNKYHDPIIEERIKMWRSCLNGCTGKEPQDLLDVMISIQDKDGKPLLTAEEIKAQTAELMYATVDNPSNAIEWALAEMINQPEILRKAVEEIDNVVGKHRLVQESDFPQLNYVKAIAREAFRLHPIVPFNVPHVATSDAIVAGYIIPKGSHVILSRTALGRNPRVWENPLLFNPDRHLTDGSAEVELAEPELRFISFSIGRRGCMGSTLGSAMTVMLFARLLQCFSWSAPPGETIVDLSESWGDLSLAKPLRALAKPRLPSHVYLNI